MIPISVPCRGANCKAKIFWLPLSNGKLHPWDDLERKVSHFATCVDAEKFRRVKIGEGALSLSEPPKEKP